MTSLAFEIGFDHYRCDLPLDISQTQENPRKSILDMRHQITLPVESPTLNFRTLFCYALETLLENKSVAISCHKPK